MGVVSECESALGYRGRKSASMCRIPGHSCWKSCGENSAPAPAGTGATDGGTAGLRRGAAETEGCLAGRGFPGPRFLAGNPIRGCRKDPTVDPHYWRG